MGLFWLRTIVVMNQNHSGELLPSVQEIQDECQRIIKSDEFKRSRRSSELLEYLVNETLSERTQYLKAYTIAVNLFNRDENFDPQTDPLVRVNAVRLRRMIQHYYLTRKDSSNVRIELTKGSYIPSFYYSGKGRTTHPLVDSSKVALRDYSYPSLAVHRFNNLNTESSKDFIADGFTHELLTELLKFKSITVISGTSDGKNTVNSSVRQHSAYAVDVRYILSGSIQTNETHFCIYVQLDDTTKQTIIWSKRYEVEFEVGKFQSMLREIAEKVATSIAQNYGVIAQNEFRSIKHKVTNNYNAYELHLYYYQWLTTFSSNDHLHAYRCLKKAVKLDPDYSDAWSSLTSIYAHDYLFSYGSICTECDLLDLAEAAAIKAIKANPQSSRAQYAMLYTKIAKDGVNKHASQIDALYQENKNNSLIIADIGLWLAISGEWERGLEMVEEAMVLNPTHPDFYYMPFIFNAVLSHNYEEALHYTKMIDMPDFFWQYIHLIVVHASLGNVNKANAYVIELKKLYPDIEKNLRYEFSKWHPQQELIDIYIKQLNLSDLNIV